MIVMAAQAATYATIRTLDGAIHVATSMQWSVEPVTRWREKHPAVYILASKRDGILYIGVTSALSDRITLHKQDALPGFTSRHRVHRLVYYEMHETMEAAILRETQLKKWRRAWKVRLIHSMNPEWIDLHDEASGEILDGPADLSRSGPSC